MWWVSHAFAEPIEPGAGLPLAQGEVPEEQLFDKVTDLPDGRAEARGRKRRDGAFVVWALPTSSSIVRYQKLGAGGVVEDHLFDSDGYPLATVWLERGVPTKATAAGVPPIDVSVTGWARQPIPGGTMWLPAAPEERPGGGVRVEALSGGVDVWIDPPTTPPTDPFSDTFRDGLIAGCGCFVVDRAAAWIDGRPGVRYRLLLPGNLPRDAVDLWAVNLGASGLWLMTFEVGAPADPIEALRSARALLPGIDLTVRP
ncbi:MAG: hypothetical protein ABMA64_35610 [Myxococcota bacterium]